MEFLLNKGISSPQAVAVNKLCSWNVPSLPVWIKVERKVISQTFGGKKPMKGFLLSWVHCKAIGRMWCMCRYPCLICVYMCVWVVCACRGLKKKSSAGLEACQDCCLCIYGIRKGGQVEIHPREMLDCLATRQACTPTVQSWQTGIYGRDITFLYERVQTKSLSENKKKSSCSRWLVESRHNFHITSHQYLLPCFTLCFWMTWHEANQDGLSVFWLFLQVHELA